MRRADKAVNKSTPTSTDLGEGAVPLPLNEMRFKNFTTYQFVRSRGKGVLVVTFKPVEDAADSARIPCGL
jgi:hypothetical protein